MVKSWGTWRFPCVASMPYPGTLQLKSALPFIAGLAALVYYIVTDTLYTIEKSTPT